MQAYINHLIDIRAAYRTPQPAGIIQYKDSQQLFDEQIEEVERFIYENPTYTLSNHCGLEPYIFPPADRLTND